jgi:hypothetical protein
LLGALSWAAVAIIDSIFRLSAADLPLLIACLPDAAFLYFSSLDDEFLPSAAEAATPASSTLPAIRYHYPPPIFDASHATRVPPSTESIGRRRHIGELLAHDASASLHIRRAARHANTSQL